MLPMVLCYAPGGHSRLRLLSINRDSRLKHFPQPCTIAALRKFAPPGGATFEVVVAGAGPVERGPAGDDDDWQTAEEAAEAAAEASGAEPDALVAAALLGLEAAAAASGGGGGGVGGLGGPGTRRRRGYEQRRLHAASEGLLWPIDGAAHFSRARSFAGLRPSCAPLLGHACAAVASIVALANEAESPALRAKVDALWAKMLDSMRQALRLQPRAPLWRHRLSSRLAFELSSRQFGAKADRYSAYYDDAGLRSLVDLQAAPHCARCVAGKLRQLLAYLLHLTADSELKEADAGDAAAAAGGGSSEEANDACLQPLLAYGGVACGGGGGAQGTLGVRLAAIAQLHASGRAVNLRALPAEASARRDSKGEGDAQKDPVAEARAGVLRKRGISSLAEAPLALVDDIIAEVQRAARLAAPPPDVDYHGVGYACNLDVLGILLRADALRAPLALWPGAYERVLLVLLRPASVPGYAPPPSFVNEWLPHLALLGAKRLVGNEAMEAAAAAMVEEGSVDEPPRAEISHLEVAAARRVLEARLAAS